MTWRNSSEHSPSRKRFSDFSETMRVRVRYNGNEYEMDGALCWGEPRGLWVLFDFPVGYGGGAHAKGDERHPAKVIAWCPKELLPSLR